MSAHYIEKKNCRKYPVSPLCVSLFSILVMLIFRCGQSLLGKTIALCLIAIKNGNCPPKASTPFSIPKSTSAGVYKSKQIMGSFKDFRVFTQFLISPRLLLFTSQFVWPFSEIPTTFLLFSIIFFANSRWKPNYSYHFSLKGT